MEFNDQKGGEDGGGFCILAEKTRGCFSNDCFFTTALSLLLSLTASVLQASDRTRCFLPTAVNPSPPLLVEEGLVKQVREPMVRTDEPDFPIHTAGVLPTEAIGIDANSTGGDRSWHRYMEIWKSDLTDIAIRRWLGLPVQDEVQVTTRRGRVSPRFLPWRPGSFVVLQTPHFEIMSRADSAESERIARDVERLYWVWTQMYFPFWSQRDQVAVTMNEWDPEELTIVEYLSRKAGQRLSSRGRHRIVLLPDAKTYQLTISNPQIAAGVSANVVASEGFYSDKLATSFFYPQESLASLAHEITHQLFEEATDRSRRFETTANTQDFWLIEGIAGHFESFHAGLTLASVGGWQSDRLQFVRYQTLIAQQPVTGLQDLRGNRVSIQKRNDLPRWYSQSILQTHFAMDSFSADSTRAEFRASLLRQLAEVYRVDISDFPVLQSATKEWADESMHRFLMVNDQIINTNPPNSNTLSLCLAGCEVTDAGWKRIPVLPRVQWFDASRTPLSSAQALRILADSQSMEQLSFEATKIDGKIMKVITNQPKLRELDLSWTEIEDAMVGELRQCPLIETLWLTGTQVTDESIAALAGLAKLKTVDVQRTQITEPGLNRLRKAMPHLEINPLQLAP